MISAEIFAKDYDYLTSESVFKNQMPLNIEIGCGQDRFILKMAKRHRKQNFIGIEIEQWILNRLIKKANKTGLNNVKLLRGDARIIVKNHLKNESISNFYINHPDPWPKKRHRQRRIIKDEFLDLILEKLKIGGKIYYTSDFEDYAYQVAGKLYSTERVRPIFKPFVTTELGDYPKTRFMMRFLKLGQPIYFCIMEKIR